jgi:hypothetical protein
MHDGLLDRRACCRALKLREENMANVTAGMEKLGRGVWYGVAPKIGSNAVIIDISHREGSWQFSYIVALCVAEVLGEHVKTWDGELETVWFQCVDRGEWVWSHGLVDSNGKITQIG